MPNKKRLFIIGAGDFGRELESWLELIQEKQRGWYIAGYLDKDKNALKGFPSDYKIIGDEDTYPLRPDDLVIVSIAKPELKESIYNKLKDKVRFFTYISPEAIVGKYNNIAEGAIICPNCIIATNVTIGRLVTINCGTQVGHDVQIRDFTSIQADVLVGGKCRIGEKVYIGPNATITPRKSIGDNVKVSAGSVVINKINKGVVVFGNPAKKI